MESFKRDTRAKLSHNPTGELFKILLRRLRIKIAWQLRAFRAAACLLILSLASCTQEPLSPDTCPGGCEAIQLWNYQKDANGIYHVPLDWTGEYLPYFFIDIEASETDPWWQYNGESVIEARFDSNTSWTIGDNLVISQPYYTPFGNYTSTGLPLPAGWTDVNLTQYEGEKINIAQPTGLRFSKKGSKLKSRRYLGPFIPEMIGDTITVYMRVFWDAGDHSVLKDHYEQKFIVE